jgi:hypothetical protein
MKGKYIFALITAMSVLLALFLAAGRPTESSPSQTPHLSAGHFLFTPPAYDSGWAWITAGSPLTLNHNLGGDRDDYVVDLIFRRLERAHHLSYGADWVGDAPKGAYWYDLTSTHIKVLRVAGDSHVVQVRVRIRVVPQADYDSGWRDISPTIPLAIDHNLGGNTDDYLVYLEAKNASGVHHLFYGVDRNRHDGGSLRWYGFRWYGLTADTIVLQRGSEDLAADEIRLRIWRAPQPDYDSGWMSIGKGEILTLEHGWGGAFGDLFLDLQFNYPGVYIGINQASYGLDTYLSSDGNTVYEWGATWYDLSGGSIRVTRGFTDGYAYQVRVRIWLPWRVYLPLTLKNYGP